MAGPANGGGILITLISDDPTGISNASVAWGDYDDGDLDILLVGYAGGN